MNQTEMFTVWIMNNKLQYRKTTAMMEPTDMNKIIFRLSTLNRHMGRKIQLCACKIRQVSVKSEAVIVRMRYCTTCLLVISFILRKAIVNFIYQVAADKYCFVAYMFDTQVFLNISRYLTDKTLSHLQKLASCPQQVQHTCVTVKYRIQLLTH